MITQIKGKNKLAYVWNKTRIVIEFYSALIIVSTLFFVAKPFWPSLLPLLSSSKATPWGVVTSIFVHEPFEHLLLNMASIAAATALLVGILSMEIVFFNDEINPKRVSLFFCLCPFLSAVAANLLCLICYPNSTAFGASGVSFAMEGVLTMASLSSIFRGASYAGYRAYFSKRRYQIHLAGNALIFLSYSLPIIFFLPNS